GNDMRAPEPAALHFMSQRFILAALNSGRMKFEAKGLTKAQKLAIAIYLAAPDSPVVAFTGYCRHDLYSPDNAPVWQGWGADPANSRYQPARTAGLTRAQLQNLKLKWAFGFPGAAATFGQPTSYAGKLFVGSEDGTVYALDSATGCLWWMFKASATVKTAVSVGNDGTAAFFGDTNGNVYALKVADGSVIWQTHPEPHSAARITGSPLLLGTRLYVPISSGEEGASADPAYPCCTFRGSVIALDTHTGNQVWKASTITEEPKPTRKNAQGVQYFGPSGAAVWSSPTADLKAHAIYIATGNNYSDPATEMSDAIVALDMKTGKRLWSRQLTPRDVWNSGCVAEKKDNCPAKKGDDYDFGAPPIVKTLPDGRRLVLAAQKSGVIYALDPDHRGEMLWSTRISKGGPLGGIEWGGAANSRYAYFPVSDFDFDNPNVGGGVFALDLSTGKQVWHVDPPKPACAGQYGCSPAQMAPPTLIPGILFAGSLDGHLRAHDTRNGQVIWDFDTAQDFKTTNGVHAHGGSLNGAGPAILNGMLFVNTGYTNAMAGNVLLAFALENVGHPQERLKTADYPAESTPVPPSTSNEATRRMTR
ncbi:MAG TPA: PQQ-binding-like beta-propeller repeat protein, partial [Candidatus Sulfotelmatobacter sp.]|nr:PQQ-binding-like beta-propeller repeat protein [Candidatus Sulfotelmatobacter sp.]